MINFELELYIEPAVSSDATELVEVLQDASLTKQEHGDDIWGPAPFTEEEILRMIQSGFSYVVRTPDGKIAGSFVLQPSDERMWGDKGNDNQALYLHRLAARREFKGKGVGNTIISWAGQKARELDRPYLRLDCPYTQRTLCDYYKNRGFIEIDRRDIQASSNRRNPAATLYRATLFQKQVD
jgi:GNAT superfamily N-acetyltransferase